MESSLAASLPFAAAIFTVALQSTSGGVAAILFSVVFAGKIEVLNRSFFSLHVIVLAVVAGWLWRSVQQSTRRREIGAAASLLCGFGLIGWLGARSATGALSHVALGSKLCFLAVLPVFFYALFREVSRAFAWCSTAFFLLLAIAAIAAGIEHVSWSFLRYVEMWVVTALAARSLCAAQLCLLGWLLVSLAASAAAFGVAQHFGFAGANPYFIGDYIRASATFGQPNPFGGFLAMAIGAAYAGCGRGGGAPLRRACHYRSCRLAFLRLSRAARS
jgi:hypothetical protein